MGFSRGGPERSPLSSLRSISRRIFEIFAMQFWLFYTPDRLTLYLYIYSRICICIRVQSIRVDCSALVPICMQV